MVDSSYYVGNYANAACPPTATATSGTQVLAHAEDVAARAGRIAEALGARLQPILRQEPNPGPDQAEVHVPRPPFFEALDRHLCMINSALTAIDQFTSRVDL